MILNVLMQFFELFYVIIALYVIVNLVALFLMINNPFKYRDINYEIPFGIDSGSQEKKYLKDPNVRYWICRNDQFKENSNWVILFHSWGRNSKRMISRGNVYWKIGFSLIFLDARSHGQSDWAKTSKAFDFYEDARKVVEIEKIGIPIVHGLSFGSIAASFYAYKYETRAAILEALPSTLEAMFQGFLRSLKLPKTLFGWIPWLIMKGNYAWDEFSPVNTLSKIKSPIFLIHGENDSMFPVDKHFVLNAQALKTNPKHKTWVVPQSPHSKMAQYPSYPNKITEFLETFDLIPTQPD